MERLERDISLQNLENFEKSCTVGGSNTEHTNFEYIQNLNVFENLISKSLDHSKMEQIKLVASLDCLIHANPVNFVFVWVPVTGIRR